MSSEQNKAIIRRLFERPSVADTTAVDELVAPDFVSHNPAASELGGGPAGVWRWLARNAAAIPDGRLTVEEQIAKGDLRLRVFDAGRRT